MNRILKCDDNILNDKYFIISRDFYTDNYYFYNQVELFFIEYISKNEELLLKDSEFKIKYLNKDNYEIFKIINYDYIINKLKNINKIYFNIKYDLNDFYICLDYIQERSIYLNFR